MNTRVVSTISAALFAALFIAGCSFGLDPAWKTKSGATALAFRIDAIVSGESLERAAASLPGGTGGPDAATSSRAIAQGGGYLYIRTLGGPTGDAGPFYGPYRVEAGSTFKTTDIPAGTYTGMGILYAAIPLGGRLANYANAATFEEAMRLPDAEFTAFTTGTESAGTWIPSPFERMLDGDASGALLKDVTIQAGTTTTLRLTLSPLTGSRIVDCSGATSAPSYTLEAGGTAAAKIKKFVQLANLSAPAGYRISELTCTATIASTGQTEIGTAALFDQTGTLVPGCLFTDTGTLATPNDSWSKTFPCAPAGTGPFNYYLYIEYTSTVPVTLTFSATYELAGQVLSVTYAGGANLAGKTLFYGVFDPAAMTKDGPPGMPYAVGMMTLDYNGDGEAVAYSTATKQPASFASGSNWAISAFVDVTQTYGFATVTDAIASFGTITPNYNDLSSDKPVLVTMPSLPYSYNLSALAFTPCKTHVFYVSGGGTAAATDPFMGPGLTVGNPATLDSVLMNAPSYLSMYPGRIEVYLLSDVPLPVLASLYSVSGELNIQSAGTTPYTITPSGSSAMGVFAIGSDARLSLMNVTVDGTGYLSSAWSPFQINYKGSLNLGPGTAIRNFALYDATGATTTGGAVRNAGGFLYMDGASISACSADQGGGLYQVASDSMPYTMLKNGSSITGCTAKTGGGAYLIDGQLEFDCSDTLPSVSGNTANGDGTGAYGGGLYILANATVLDPFNKIGTVVSGNTPDQWAGAGSVDIALHRMYVTEAGSGTGLTAAEPASFATALADPKVYEIILVGDIPVAQAMTVSRSLSIRTADGTPRAIILSSSIAGALFGVSGGFELRFENVQVGPLPGATGISAASLVRVESGSSFYLGYGAVLRNNTTSADGGAVYNNGGNVYIYGGTITNCGTSGAVGAGAIGGGAVFVTAMGTLEMGGGLITGCSAGVLNGGGVYLESGYFYISGGSITACSAANGAGVYVATGGTMNLNSLSFSITGNTATTLGGGVLKVGNGMVNEYMTGAASCISGNTATGATEPVGVTQG